MAVKEQKGSNYMRNPNGFGGVVDLGKHRRNRYAARITDASASSVMDSDGKFRQKYRYIGYYPTRKDAMSALYEWNKLNTPMEYHNITFAEIWQIWCNRNIPDINTSRARSYASAFKKCNALHNKYIENIRLNDLQQVLDFCAGSSKSTLNNIKVVMNFIFTWAVENDVVSKNYAQYVKLNYRQVESHKAFTSDEIFNLWSDPNKYSIVLMFVYTGCRPSELCDLKLEDVNLKEQYFYIRKSKTTAGVRYVPIADKILPFFEYYYTHSNTDRLLPLNYLQLKDFYKAELPPHTPHDTRSTCVSMLTAAGVQEVIIQKIVGHSGGNVTRDVYTQLEIKPLLDAINKI